MACSTQLAVYIVPANYVETDERTGLFCSITQCFSDELKTQIKPINDG
jgi:hypothetical protein